jgi:hypothetical protein
MTAGSRANQSGNVLEKTVAAVLDGHGYVALSQDLPKKQRLAWLLNSHNLPKRYAQQVYIGLGIYHTDIFVDFYIIDVEKYPQGLIIECKWQQSGGSVDEKLPYVNLNIEKCYPAPAIVVIDGGGMKPGAIAWLKEQVPSNPNLFAVYDLSSFMIWANNHL